MATLDAKLNAVVGGRTATPLEKAFGMHTVRDLLAHYPRRMAERGELTDLAALRIDDEVTVVADVRTAKVVGFGKGERLEVVVGDGKSTLAAGLLRPPQHLAAEGTPARRARPVLRQGGRVPRPAPARPSRIHAVARRRRGRDRGRRLCRRADPGLPGHPGGAHLAAVQRGPSRPRLPRPRPRPAARTTCAPGRSCSPTTRRCARCTSRTTTRTGRPPGAGSRGTRRWAFSSRSPSGAGWPARIPRFRARRSPAVCSRRSTPGCRSPSPPGSARSAR